MEPTALTFHRNLTVTQVWFYHQDTYGKKNELIQLHINIYKKEITWTNNYQNILK